MKEFFPLHPDAVGLDISDRSVKICKLSRNKQGCALASFGETPIKEGLVERGEVKNGEALSRAIKEAAVHVKGKRLDAPYVIASLPEEKAFTQIIQLPVMKQEEVEQAIRFQAESFIPYPLATMVLDFQIISSPKVSLDHLDVLIAAMPVSVVDSYLSAIQGANLVPLAFETESLAASRALISHGAAPVSTLIVDLGYARANVIVFAGFSVRFSVALPLSSAQCADAIAKTLSVSGEEAEKLKQEYGILDNKTARGKDVAKALAPFLSDLVSQLKKYISYYDSHPFHVHGSADKSSIRRVMLCGGGSLLGGLPEFLSKELQLEVGRGNPWVNILPDPVIELPSLKFEESLKYATALGLALRGIGKDASV